MSWPDWTSLMMGVGIGFYAALRRDRSDRPIPSSSPPIAPVAIALVVDPEPEEAPAIDPAPVTEPAQPPSPMAANIVPDSTTPDSTTNWQTAYQLARQWGEFQGGFLARAAHELRSPLSSTIGLHQMILNDLCDDLEEEHQCVADANRAAQRMVDLLDRLIEIAKMNSGAIAPNQEAVSLELIFDEVEALTCMQAANRNIGLDFEIPPAIEVLADSKRLRQALALAVDSVIANLARAGDNGPVVLTAATTGDRTQILLTATAETANWSEPIDLMQQPPPTAASLAELQAGAATVQLSPMMGLWVAQLAIESMNGDLDLRPQPDGIQLCCTIPIAA